MAQGTGAGSSGFLARAAARPVPWVILLGVLIFLPSLRLGFYVDDWFHLATLERVSILPERGPLDLFTFARPGDAWPALQGHYTPWWADDAFAASFFRPLTALTHLLDHRLWGRHPLPYHASNLLIWALLLAAVARLHAELARDSARPAWVALLAGALYALDEAHTWNVAWLANRNALLAVLFSVEAVVQYHRWRRDGRPLPLLLASAAFVLGLLAGETAACVLLWVAAYELFLGDGRLFQRALAASPILAILLIYMGIWLAGDYGTSGSGLYVDPFREPLRWAGVALGARLPYLLAGLLTPLPPEIGFFLGLDAEAALLPGVWLLDAIFVAMLLPLLRRDPVCRFLGLAALLSLVPLSSTFPAGRLLLFSSAGVAYLVACFVHDAALAWGRVSRAVGASRGPSWALALAALLLLIHGVAAPVLLVLGTEGLRTVGEAVNAAARGAQLPDGAAAEPARILVLQAPDPLTPTYLPIIRSVEGHTVPEAYWNISNVPGAQTLVRTGIGTFTLEAPAPGFLASGWERLFRTRVDAEPGERFQRGALGVTADRVDDGTLLRIAVDPGRDLDDPNLWLLGWDGERMRRMEAPPVGSCVVLPAAKGVMPGLLEKRADVADDCGAQVVWVEEGAGAATATTAAAAVAVAKEECRLEIEKEGAWQERARFPCPADGSLRMLVMGDVGRPGAILDGSTAAALRRCGEKPCQLLLVPGDLVYGPGEAAATAWPAVWDSSLARIGLPSLFVLGNHEYREESAPELKRQAIFASDGQKGAVIPAASYVARVVRGGAPVLAIAAMDTDSIANPGIDMPGGAEEALRGACSVGVPVLTMGHHPPSSQGLHHGHEARVEEALRSLLLSATKGGCRVAAALAGHDHDLQAYSPGCEAKGMPGVVVSGTAAKGFRPPGEPHLSPCPEAGAESQYHAGPKETGGFALLELLPAASGLRVELVESPGGDEARTLSTMSWALGP